MRRVVASLPPLPSSVDLPAGPWRVVRAEPPSDPGEDVCGSCDWRTRTLTVKPRIARAVAWLTLEHEIVHAILFDAGVKLSNAKEEAVAHAIALARVHAMRQ